MNIFFRELKSNRKALIIWSVCMILLVASGMAKYSAFAAGGASNQIFNTMPYSIKALLGFGTFDISVMSGYFAMLFLYIELTTAIHAILLGAGIIAKEERDKTTEFLMIKPISRATVITAKLTAAFINIIVINIVTMLSSVYMIKMFNTGKDITTEIMIFCLSMFIVQFVFLSFGAALAALTKNPKISGSLAVGVLLSAFIVSKITDLYAKLDFLNIFTPFKYFSYADMAAGNALSILTVLLSLLLAAVFITTTYIFYNKRDLSI